MAAKRTRTKAPKAAKKSKKQAPVADVEVLDEAKSGGLGIEDGIVLFTTLALGVSLYCMYTLMSRYPG